MKNSTIKENVIMIGSFLVITILLIYIVVQIASPKLSVKVFGFKPYVVITESMEPEIMVRDMVIVRKFDFEEAEEGDIITFEADINYDGTKEVVTHYIYLITENENGPVIRTNRYYENQDDATPDPWVLSPDDVLGTYWFQIPKLGFVTDFLKSPFGIAAILVNATVIGGIVYLVKLSKKQQLEQTSEETKEKE